MEDEGLDPAEPTEADTAAPQISESQKRLVQRVHINIGHPPKDRFLRALRAAGALPQILHYVHNEYQCDDCRLRQRPDFHRKAQLPRTFSFNKVVCLDFLYVKWRDLNVAVFNMVDLGILDFRWQSGHQLPNARSSKLKRKVFKRCSKGSTRSTGCR